METKFLRREVERPTLLSKVSIYRKMQVGTNPMPLKLGPRAVDRRADEIHQWIASRPRVQKAICRRRRTLPGGPVRGGVRRAYRPASGAAVVASRLAITVREDTGRHSLRRFGRPFSTAGLSLFSAFALTESAAYHRQQPTSQPSRCRYKLVPSADASHTGCTTAQ